MLQAGAVIGSYELVVQLSKLQYIQSWQARGTDEQDYVLRIFPAAHVQKRDGDEWQCAFDGAPYIFHTKEDLYTHLNRTPGDSIRELLALPPIPSLAPLLGYEIIEWEHYILAVVSRRFYSDRLTDRFPAEADRPSSRSLLDSFALLASALDTLEGQMPKLDFDLAPGDLLLDGDVPLIADYGLAQYHNYMDFNNRMWSSRVEHEGKRSLVGMYPGKDKFQRTSAQFCLAALYVYIRSRFLIFEDLSKPYPQEKIVIQRMAWVGAVFEAFKKYEVTGELSLAMLPDSREQAVVAKALAREPSNRYSSCRDFIEALKAL